MEKRDVKKIMISEAHQDENLLLAAYLLGEGHFVTLVSPDIKKMQNLSESLTEEQQNRCFIYPWEEYSEEKVSAAVDEILRKMNGLDFLINGLPCIDEVTQFKASPDTFGWDVASDFSKLFILNREIVRYMVRQKAGDIIFLLIDDILYFADYLVSPVQHQGRLALMKSMAKELSPFNIRVNSLTFGMYDPGLEFREKRLLKKKLEFCALKPSIPKWEELLPAIDALIYPAFKHMTGQNYPACIGTSSF